MKCSNIHVIGIPEGEKSKLEIKNIFEEKRMGKNWENREKGDGTQNTKNKGKELEISRTRGWNLKPQEQGHGNKNPRRRGWSWKPQEQVKEPGIPRTKEWNYKSPQLTWNSEPNKKGVQPPLKGKKIVSPTTGGWESEH